MYAIIAKDDYWGYLDRGALNPIATPWQDLRHDITTLIRGGLRSRVGTSRLKDIQDAFVLDALSDAKGKRVLELGGGDSRILRHLARSNECWNVDKLVGEGGGPVKIRNLRNVKVVRDYMGSFNPAIPDDAFDYVVSVSAVEHIPTPAFADAMRDCHRVLKRGGLMYHAIDIYLFDRPDQHRIFQERLALYHSVPELTNSGFEWIEPPEITGPVTASASHAANHCDELFYWNRSAPALRNVRAIGMSCSIRMGLRKVA